MAHYTGLYYIPQEMTCSLVGMNIPDARKAFEELENMGLIEYDHENLVVWVINLFKHQVYVPAYNLSDRQKKGVESHFLTLHETSLIRSFVEHYELKLKYDCREKTERPAREEKKSKEKEAPEFSFDAFWALYPGRNGKKDGKEKCRVYYKRFKNGDRELVIQGARNYADSTQAREGFAKDPIRFLQEKGWIDWQEPEGTALPEGKKDSLWR
jgi:hypothetical protein